ncbi:SsrA-binding protein SmpB [Photobacterium kishitanii]|uniref:SsrA-binding protein n=1 Tax=Photobacterium kishitanii TaxID=318456 RepID=A0A2T3KB05_9GAMM|nr:SsrA-binding protein SmpB [Photobacterium kishitanii]PSU89785.1 SsrA-binding protein [Photobacterium kishitanii]
MKSKKENNNIAKNRSARFDFHIDNEIEAGIVLQGWEVKSIRAGKVNLTESYVYFKNGEAFISGVEIQPLIGASTHTDNNPTRIRKLLLKKMEIERLNSFICRDGKTVISLNMYWSGSNVKVKIASATGKNNVDKRHAVKERDWNRDKNRLVKRL